METTIFGAGTILAIGLVGFVMFFWYGNAIARVFKPVSRMLEAGDAHAQVYSAEVKNNAITRASKIIIDPKMLKQAQANLKMINSFDLDANDAEAVAS